MVSWLVVAFRRWGCPEWAALSSPFLTNSCRHYFLKHLADVVNGNSKRKHDVDVPEKGIQPADREHQSGRVAGVTKRLNSRSARAIQKVEDGESRSISSPDYVSGALRNPRENRYIWSISRLRFAVYVGDFGNARPSNSRPPSTESPAFRKTWSTLRSRAKALPQAPRKVLALRDRTPHSDIASG